jgi:hypothetical protein
MQQPDTGEKVRIGLKEGDSIEILKGGDPTSDDGANGNWVHATVVANSEQALTVAYADGAQEVIPWKSGRIRGSDGKET